jgi:hypothetical protein
MRRYPRSALSGLAGFARIARLDESSIREDLLRIRQLVGPQRREQQAPNREDS